MIEIYLLEQLDAFARHGTLSAASEELHISQPALTRSMKKIEEELGVSLFERHKNRLSLNENGKLAAFDTISFADLEGIPMLQYTKVGFWYDLTLRKVPNPHLLLQDSRETFTEIANASTLPTFFSSWFDKFERRGSENRKIIPLSDPEASVTYYLVCVKKEYSRFRSFFSHLDEWAW